MENLRVGPSAAAKNEDVRSFIIRDAAANKLQKGGFSHAGVFEIRERGSRKNGETSGMAVRFFQDNLIGKTCEAHYDRIAAPRADQVELGELHYGGFSDAGAKELGDIVAVCEMLLAAAGQADECDAVVVGKAGLAGFRDLLYLVIVDVQATKSLNCSEVHAGTIESCCIQRSDVLTSENERRDCEDCEQDSPVRRNPTLAWTGKVAKRHVYGNCSVDRGRWRGAMSEVTMANSRPAEIMVCWTGSDWG